MDALSSAWNTYVNDLPHNWAKSAVISFTCGFVATTVLTTNPVLGAMYGGFSATASLIYSAITPLFKQLFSQGERVDVLEEWLKSGIALIVTGTVASALGITMVINNIWSWLLVHNLFLSSTATRENSRRIFCLMQFSIV